MKEKQIRRMGVLTIILTFISVIVMYVTHKAVPFMMDDLWYSTMLSSETPIASLGDIVQSQIWHYFNWGGRSMTHGILQLTLLAGETAADILNVAVTLLLSALVCLLAEDRKLFSFFAAVAMLTGLNANWKMSMFWQAGAANYLYITVFVLGFLYCYLREDNGKKLTGISVWIIPLGILAGWSNENMGPAVWIISLIVILLNIREKKKVRFWMAAGSISCFLGSVMVVAAPGNFVRSVQVASNEYGLLWNCFLRGYAQSKAALEYLFPVILLLACLLVISKGILKLPLGRKNILLLLCALLSWGAMVLSPHYPDRAAFGTMVLLICVVLSLMRRIRCAKPDTAWLLWGINVFIWLRGMYFMGEFLANGWGWIR